MKKFSAVIFAMLMSASLVLGQTGGDKNALNPQPPPGRKAQPATATATKTTSKKSGKKGHKGGKKGKKSSGGSTTPPPK